MNHYFILFILWNIAAFIRHDSLVHISTSSVSRILIRPMSVLFNFFRKITM